MLQTDKNTKLSVMSQWDINRKNRFAQPNEWYISPKAPAMPVSHRHGDYNVSIAYHLRRDSMITTLSIEEANK